nr:hypothetical protein [Tanacetum cinerariifolium]
MVVAERAISITEDRILATSQAYKIVESQKFLAAQSRVYEGSNFVICISQAGLNDGYKNYISEKELPDELERRKK